jgi:nucleoside-diphosphate-sugar epimerase
MRILVTGSSGGIGKWMVKRLLQAGHTVRSLDVHAQPPGGNEHLPGDVRDLAFVRRAMQGMEAVIHLAALPYDMPGQEEMVLDVNLRGTWNILLACGEVGVSRVVYFSSINALGQSEPEHNELYLPLDDEIPHHPTQNYGMTKHLSEQMCAAFAARTGGTAISLRPSLVTHPIGGMEHRWWAMMPQEMKVQFAVNDFFSYVDVRDVCEAALLSLTTPIVGHRAFLLTADDSRLDIPSGELVNRFYAHLPWPKITQADYLNGPIYKSLVDCSAAKQALGWQPRFSQRDPAAGYIGN